MLIEPWRVFVAVSLFVGLLTVWASPIAAADGGASAGASQLTLLKTIPIGGSGRWDYLCADSTARRLYVPRSTHVQILDLDTGVVLGDVADTNGVHGVALAPEQGLGFSSNGRDNTLSAFDLKTFKVGKIVKTGRNPDAILYDPASKHILYIYCAEFLSVNRKPLQPIQSLRSTIMSPCGGKLGGFASKAHSRILCGQDHPKEVFWDGTVRAICDCRGAPLGRVRLSRPGPRR